MNRVFEERKRKGKRASDMDASDRFFIKNGAESRAFPLKSATLIIAVYGKRKRIVNKPAHRLMVPGVNGQSG